MVVLCILLLALPIVFYNYHWSKILSAILGMKTIYCKKHNIRLVNPKQRAGR